MNELLSIQERYPLDRTDRMLYKAPASLNVSDWEILWPLSAGAAVVISSQGDHRDAASLATTVRHSGATMLHITPSVLAALVSDEAAATACKQLRGVICSGEPLLTDLAARFSELCGVPLYHLYAPSEAAPHATSWSYRPGSKALPLGHPSGNTEVYVLDSHLQLTPVGVIGEVYVAGAAIGRGYLDRRGVTAGEFIACPFGPPGSRMYRTGDLACWNVEGELEYAGSLDRRIRVRGFWADPFEIESALTNYAGVAQAAVVARPDSSEAPAQLTAYVVPATAGRMGAGADVDFSAGLDVVELRRFVAGRLSEYLIPTTIIVLDQFPRNMFRGTARSFATDRKAVEVARGAVARGFDESFDKDGRAFLYLPFEHSEELADQERAVELFTPLGDPEYTHYAVAHRDIIARYGRFPHRNALLGRTSTAEEEEFLRQPGSSF